MLLRFTKMHGLGNDFMVLDLVSQHAHILPKHAKQWGDRHTGIGFDQLLLVEAPNNPDVDFRYRIFNSDGSEVEQCGNGARCFARYVADKGLANGNRIRVRTLSGVIEPELNDDGRVTVDMGPPIFDAAAIPFDAAGLQPQPTGAWETWRLALGAQADAPRVAVAVLSMGNPHAVQEVPDVDTAAVAAHGPLVEHHPRFPNRVNAGFMQVVDRGRIRLRVWERGAGETLACGTGACAAVVAGIRLGRLDREVDVETRGGLLTIRWDGGAGPVFMTGPAVTVFEGEIELRDPA
ncbi:MAG: diaminopimelate epimerase [Comamonadaceae bacterium]|nr:MAG: diaminopimelate epimerase [Comamonadaceae bacterium]